MKNTKLIIGIVCSIMILLLIVLAVRNDNVLSAVKGNSASESSEAAKETAQPAGTPEVEATGFAEEASPAPTAKAEPTATPAPTAKPTAQPTAQPTLAPTQEPEEDTDEPAQQVPEPTAAPANDNNTVILPWD